MKSLPTHSHPSSTITKPLTGRLVVELQLLEKVERSEVHPCQGTSVHHPTICSCVLWGGTDRALPCTLPQLFPKVFTTYVLNLNLNLNITNQPPTYLSICQPTLPLGAARPGARAIPYRCCLCQTLIAVSPFHNTIATALQPTGWSDDLCSSCSLSSK